ncbi:piggyBac transposable element-derived protein 3-like [Cotesia glomerata]|uniref:piggyBac transposable element-derived protein 3-like n=1 Tax=Cotesia glomerata TaxID=32391 RepID=UPI001D009BB6|nr:piggyBac transposable element-derived protein 3-like [Cotesia glomerata]
MSRLSVDSDDELSDEENLSDLDIMSDGESEHSEHNSETEQSATDSDDDSDTDTDTNNNKSVKNKAVNTKYVLGKDKSTRWFSDPPNPKVRTQKHNIVTGLPGPTKLTKNSKTPKDCWNLFLPAESIEQIVAYTNIFLEKLHSSKKKKTDIQPTSYVEINAMIGLLYMLGVHKDSRVSLKELWGTDGTAPDCYRAVMSKSRFCTLLAALKFDDINDREERKKVDNLAPIREFSDSFIERCQQNYTPGEYLTIDEMLQAFRGRCKFRQYIANKPARYGIKIYSMADSKRFYTYNMEIYCGKQPPGPHVKSNSAIDVVKRLTAPILNTGRNVTCDNYFTSVPLANYLLKNKTTIVGTIRRNKRELPRELLEIKNRNICSSKFVFTDNSVLVSYIPKKSKNVLMYSTMHNSASIDNSTGEKAKPEIITFYNKTKAGVDVVDQLQGDYNVARDTRRWPMVVFYAILNIAGINSRIIYEENVGSKIVRREFLRQLFFQLVQPQLVLRSQLPNLKLELRSIVLKIGNIKPEKQTHASSRRLCCYCPRRANSYTTKSCSSCNTPLCNQHTVRYCTDCDSNLISKDDL